jgi:frataxin-like iron-binding protein CyaY
MSGRGHPDLRVFNIDFDEFNGIIICQHNFLYQIFILCVFMSGRGHPDLCVFNVDFDEFNGIIICQHNFLYQIFILCVFMSGRGHPDLRIFNVDLCNVDFDEEILQFDIFLMVIIIF